MKPVRCLIWALGVLCLAGCGSDSTDRSGLVTIGPPFHKLSFDQALERAKAEEKIVMVDFYADWCGPCRQLDAITWKDAKVQGWLGEKTIAIKIDIDKESKLAEKHRIQSIPALVFFRPDGTEAGRLVGFMGPEQFLKQAGELVK